MRAFIDTSSLIKKYINEKGSHEFDVFLEKTSEIIVSPIYLLEVNSAIERRVREKTLPLSQVTWIRAELKKDFHYFSQIIWNEKLIQKGLELILKYQLKTLDTLQLASACLAQTDIFITSDKRLFNLAQSELNNARFV